MKKTLLTLATMSVAAGAFAQGTISFQATSTTGYIYYSTDNQTETLYPTTGYSSYGSGHVMFYTAPSGTVLALGGPDNTPNFTTAWTAATSVVNVAISAGKTSGATVTGAAQSGAPAANVEMEIVGWSGTATSFAAAVAAGNGLIGYTGEIFNGSAVGSLGWVQATGDPATTPPGTPGALVTGSGGYSGLVLESVPEPSTIALGGLGAAALLLFRRRK